MGEIIVRKISDETLDALRVRAEESNLPLEAYVRDVLDAAARQPTIKELALSHAKLKTLWSKQAEDVADSVPLLRAERFHAGG